MADHNADTKLHKSHEFFSDIKSSKRKLYRS